MYLHVTAKELRKLADRMDSVSEHVTSADISTGDFDDTTEGDHVHAWLNDDNDLGVAVLVEPRRCGSRRLV